MPRYRLNVDFDNSIEEFLYNGTGSYAFTVPAAPNFDGTRYLVYLPAVLYLKDASKLPAISGYTRIEGTIPGTAEFRTIAASQWDTLLLKDAIEFPAASAGASLTMTNFYTVGSTVSPDQFVDTLEAQTVAGVKTFSSIPVLPASDPTTDNQAARRKFITDLDSANVKLTGNQTIAGVKTFSSNPVLPTSKVSVYNGTTYSLLSDAQQAIIFGSEIFDTLGEHSTSTNRFTASESGYYFVTTRIRADIITSNGFNYILIFKNGSEVARSPREQAATNETGLHDFAVSALVYLAATDYINIYYEKQSGYDVDITGGVNVSFMNIFRVL